MQRALGRLDEVKLFGELDVSEIFILGIWQLTSSIGGWQLQPIILEAIPCTSCKSLIKMETVM